MRLILHHWDTDGICSAALLYDSNSINMTPKIGNYFLEEDEIRKIEEKNYNEICIVDLAIHADSLRKLAEITKVRVFDHHLTKRLDNVEYINPILDGEDEEEHPSASWVVGTFLNIDNLLAFLGAVGDWEERIKQTTFYVKLKKFMERERITFEEMSEMVKLIDSNYKVGDKLEVERAVNMLHNAEDVKTFVLENEKWRRNKEKIDKEIEKALSGEEKKIDKVRIKEIDCPYNIISTVARRLWNKKEYVMVINRGYFKDKCQIYVRGDSVAHLIQMAISHGYVAGGKKNVMGAIVPKQECDEFIKKILEVIND